MNEQSAILGQVLISGGTRGLGRALSLKAAGAGRCVLAIYRSEGISACSLTEEGKGRITCLRHDISESAPSIAVEGEGLVFIHAAAPSFVPRSMHLCSDEEFLDQWKTAALGFKHGLTTVLRPMIRARGGTIVVVLTTAIRDSPPKGFGPYISAKCALEGLVRAAAAEYRRLGVRFLCVAPGFMDTAFSEQWDPSLRTAVASSQVGGPQSPKMIADWIWDLIQDPTAPGEGETYLF